MLIADFTGLTVGQFEELRVRLEDAGSKIHVTKNSYIKRVVKDASLPEGLADCLTGQSAIVTGAEDVCAAAKVLKNFKKEFERPSVKMGVLDGKLLTEADVEQIAGLPSRDQLLGQLLGLLQAPATSLARLLNEPGSHIARAMQAHVYKG